MRSIFSIFSALYLCLTLQNVCLVFGQNFDVQLCKAQRDSGPCKALIPMYAYDNQTDTCIQFIYGGCGGNGNRFTTQEECKNSCQTGQVKPNSQKEESIQKCLLEPETGICLGYIQRYHFNAKTGRCEQFVYGGCGGNENNFKSIEECVESCEHKIESTISEYVEEDPCSFNVTVGPCKALLHRFYYDRDTGKCIPFIYGGCNGNANNFEVIEECEKKCISKKTDTYYSDEKSICELNLDSGPCEALIPRYFFDHKLGKCEKFTYGGCQGNANNFKTIDECQQICANQTIPSIDTTIDTTKLIKEGCEQKSEPGTCRGYFPRYYYDLDTKDCQQFIYGGCNGNINNFETYESCQEFCMN